MQNYHRKRNFPQQEAFSPFPAYICISNNTNPYLKHVRLHILLFVFFSAFSSEGFAQWEKVLEVGDSTIFDINFLTSDEVPTNGIVSIFGLGVTTTSAVTFRTMDGGSSWKRQSSPNIFYNTGISATAIKDSKTLWLGTGNILVNELSKWTLPKFIDT